MHKIEESLNGNYRNMMNTCARDTGKLPIPRKLRYKAECIASSQEEHSRPMLWNADRGYSGTAHAVVKVLLRIKKGVYKELPDCYTQQHRYRY